MALKTIINVHPRNLLRIIDDAPKGQSYWRAHAARLLGIPYDRFRRLEYWGHGPAHSSGNYKASDILGSGLID